MARMPWWRMGATMGSGNGGPRLFGKGRSADPQGPGLQDDEVACFPTVHSISWGWPKWSSQLQGDVRQVPDLVIGEAGGLGLLRRQGNLLHSPAGPQARATSFFGHPGAG